jgi:hypothetical protein
VFDWLVLGALAFAAELVLGTGHRQASPHRADTASAGAVLMSRVVGKVALMCVAARVIASSYAYDAAPLFGVIARWAIAGRSFL